MANLTEQLNDLFRRVNGLQSRLTGLSPDPNLFAATGERISYGCKVTEGSSASDRTITLEGQAAGDSAHLNPEIASPTVYPFEFANIAFTKSGGFFSDDINAQVAAAPGAGLGRYDIAYIFNGPAGPGFDVATGTPSAGIKTDYDLNGLETGFYDPSTDVAIPVGAFPVARIYCESIFSGVANAQIADIRDFDGTLRGAALTWDDLTSGQKDELIVPAAAAATVAVLADNEEFKQEQRVLFWLGI
jgi:hypothetical protein